MNIISGNVSKPEIGSASMMLCCPSEQHALLYITQFFSKKSIRLEQCSQHLDSEYVFLRLVWTLTDDWIDEASFYVDFDQVASALKAQYDVRFNNRQQSIGVFISQDTKLLRELLNQGVIYSHFDVAFIASNNVVLSDFADRCGVPFFLIEDDSDSAQSQAKLAKILQRYEPEFLGLFDCFNDFSSDLLSLFSGLVFSVSPMPLISPGTIEAGDQDRNVYEEEFKHGAKLLGAMTHFVKSSRDCCHLSAGPIINQSVVPIQNGHSIADIPDLASEVEIASLSTALKLLLEHKVLKFNNRTIIFDS